MNHERPQKPITDELDGEDRPSMTDLDEEMLLDWERHKSRRRLRAAAAVSDPE